VEQISLGCETYQDVCLLGRTILPIVALVCEKFIELGNPAASLLELRSEGLEGSAVFSLKDRKLFKHFWCKRRAGVRGRSFHQAIQRITDLFGLIDGGSDSLFMNVVMN
jgi:hypothetical protein